jgi:PadR family transcriptional regulator AphA
VTRTDPILTTTRFAVLGELALRDWSAYELTRSMRRTLRFFWPRAESVIYAEAKRLEADGLATSRSAPADDGSRRNKTVYAITDAGRAALSDWLGTPSAPPAIYAEPLLRVHLARFGDIDDLRTTIDVIRKWAEDVLSAADAVATEFAAGQHVFQHEAHIRGLLFDALASTADNLRDWAARADREVASWASIDGSDRARGRALRRMRSHLRERRPPQ